MAQDNVLDTRADHDETSNGSRPQQAGGPAPSGEAAVANLIPGAERLGYGMNIFAGYSLDLTLDPLFHLGDHVRHYVDPATGVPYAIPSNVSDPSGSSSTARAYTFETGREVNQHFQASAQVSGSVGAFNGAFKAAYSHDQQDSSMYSYALLESQICTWNVDLRFGVGSLRAEVRDAMNALPQQFTEQNREPFFTFFRNFGTHFVRRVYAGGMLRYFVSVSREANLSSKAIEGSVTAEYKGLVASTQGEAEASWNQTVEGWTQSRQASAFTVPASNLVDWVDPAKGTYDSNGSFDRWQHDAKTNPQSMNFLLEPISRIFQGAQQSAVEEAFAAYGNSRVHLEANQVGLGAILVDGKPIIPVDGFPSGEGLSSWHLVVLDRATLHVVFNKLYVTGLSGEQGKIYYMMLEDVGRFAGDTGKILLASASELWSLNYPSEGFYQFLKSFGAGGELDRWMQVHGCSPGAAYALAGVGGASPGSSLDRFLAWNEGPRVTVDGFLQLTGKQYTPVAY